MEKKGINIEYWDFMGWKNMETFGLDEYYLQKDWNQTILTKFNMLSENLEKPVVVTVSNNYKPIFESLEYYFNEKIGDKYIIEFIDDNDVIKIGNSQLVIKNYIDERLKNVNLINELRETFEDMELQLHEDEKRWGDTWKKRGLSYKNLSQEERFMNKMQQYYTDWKDLGVPFPWTKVIGEAHICLVREKKLTDLHDIEEEID